MMRWWLLPGLVVGALAVWNAGVLIDALVMRGQVARARAFLPAEWQTISAENPAERADLLMAAWSEGVRTQALAEGVVFQPRGDAVVLAIPRGLDTDVLRLDDLCFDFVRRRVDLIVIQFDIPTGCL